MIDSDLATVAAHSGVCAENHSGISAEELASYSPEEVQEIRTFMAYVRAKRVMRNLDQASGSGPRGKDYPA